MSNDLQNKRVFLIITANPDRESLFTYLIQKHVSQSTVFCANDGNSGLFKFTNAPAHVVLLDIDLPKLDGLTLTQTLLAQKSSSETGLIIVGPIPPKEQFIDEIVTGQVQFLEHHNDEKVFIRTINKSLNYVSRLQNTDFKVRFLSPMDILIQEGDTGDTAFLVKRGKLRAYSGPSSQPQILGEIAEGEFVGEMAHFTTEARSATIQALTDCELIEIPGDTLDHMLFNKPSWAKALMKNLSQRLKKSITAQKAVI